MFKILKPISALIYLNAFFCVPKTGFAQTARDFQDMKQTLMVLRAELADLRAKSFPIGSVQQSFLTEAEFQKHMGSNWVLCDGRSVPGSSWERFGYGSKVPNCAGRFLRTAGDNAAPLRMEQQQATAKNGLQLSATTNLTSDLNVNVSGTTADATWAGVHATAITDSASSGPLKAGLEAWGNHVVGRDGEYWGQMFSHTHVFAGTGTANGGSWKTTVNLSGDNETRPINITVNTFVKIN
jgi:hypothetical protein